MKESGLILEVILMIVKILKSVVVIVINYKEIVIFILECFGYFLFKKLVLKKVRLVKVCYKWIKEVS